MKRFSGGLLFVIGLIGSQSSLATLYDVLKGSSYLVTQPGTFFFGGVPFVGVPTGPGGSDTIIERLQDVNLGSGAPASGTSTALLTQLELKSAIPVNLGLGGGFYYITLQSARGGPATTGSTTITLNANDDHAPSTAEGTFSGFFDVFFDLRFGSAIGPIALSGDSIATVSGASWDANPTSVDFLVPGLLGDVTANFHTNKLQDLSVNDMDFFPIGAYQSLSPNGGIQVLADARVPEPGTMALIGLGFAGLAATRRRKIN